MHTSAPSSAIAMPCGAKPPVGCHQDCAPAALTQWCQAWPALAARVTGVGTCTTPDGQTWATDVRLADADGGTLYLLYDPASGDLVSVSTIASGGETDYGTCGAHSGIVTCAGAAYRCAP